MARTIIPTFTMGDRLAKARSVAHISSSDMASELGVSRGTVYNYEADRTEPPVHVVKRWSEVTGVPVTWLIDADDDGTCFSHGVTQLEMFANSGRPENANDPRQPEGQRGS
jgi:transcriptional regulator with XRE-family HTH domain